MSQEPIPVNKFAIFMDGLMRRLPTGQIESDHELEQYWFWFRVSQLLAEVNGELGFANEAKFWSEHAEMFDTAIADYTGPLDDF